MRLARASQIREPLEPVARPAPPLVPVRFHHLEPGQAQMRSSPGDLEVAIVMLSGALTLAAAGATTALERDDIVAVGGPQRYELANASGEAAWFIELWRPRPAPVRPALHRITADRRTRIRTIVDLLPELPLSAVILCAGDAVTCSLGPERAACAISTVGVIAVNDLPVGARSAAIVRGPGRVTLRALESSEVLLIPAPDLAHGRRAPSRVADQPATIDPSR